MNTKLKIEEGVLYYDDHIFFDDNKDTKVRNALIVDKFIVLLVEPNSLFGDQNIICCNLGKIIIWQIADIVKLQEKNYYTSIYLQDQKLYGYNINGVEVTIDVNTGNILTKELIR